MSFYYKLSKLHFALKMQVQPIHPGKSARSDKQKRKKKMEKDGVHGTSPLIGLLEDFHFHDFSFDLMSYSSSSSQFLMNIYKGERPLKSLPPLAIPISIADQHIEDARHKMVIIPPQYKNNFFFGDSFWLPGLLKPTQEHFLSDSNKLCTIETEAVREGLFPEGLFPESEQVFIFHVLVDVML